jgi:threonine dehydrogenase-like Zn-dependent dehydrogenase
LIHDRKQNPVPEGDYFPLGYSLSGIVEAVGEGITDFRPGDRVACAGMGVANHAEYVCVGRNLTMHVPEGTSLPDAAFSTMCSIAMHPIRQTRVALGDTVAVFGTGVIGLLCAEFARLGGARTVVIGQSNDMRLEMARSLGNHRVVKGIAEDPVEAVLSFTGGLGADVVLFAAATDDPRAGVQALDMLRDRGTFCMVGVVPIDWPRTPFFKKELTFSVSRSYGPGRYDPSYEVEGHDYPIAFVRWTEKRNMQESLRLMAEGRLNVGKLVTHEFAFERAIEAYDLLLKRREETVAVVLAYE